MVQQAALQRARAEGHFEYRRLQHELEKRPWTFDPEEELSEEKLAWLSTRLKVKRRVMVECGACLGWPNEDKAWRSWLLDEVNRVMEDVPLGNTSHQLCANANQREERSDVADPRATPPIRPQAADVAGQPSAAMMGPHPLEPLRELAQGEKKC